MPCMLRGAEASLATSTAALPPRGHRAATALPPRGHRAATAACRLAEAKAPDNWLATGCWLHCWLHCTVQLAALLAAGCWLLLAAVAAGNMQLV